MKGGCMETSLMMMLVVLVSIILGFVVGMYYQKQQSIKQLKENFSLSTKETVGISVGVSIGVLLIIILILFLIAYKSNKNIFII